jgi:hypothetical protein
MKQLFSVMFISVVVEFRKYFNIYLNKAHKLEPYITPYACRKSIISYTD